MSYMDQRFFQRSIFDQVITKFECARPTPIKTTFYMHQGYFAFLVMPFVLINATVTFQALMNNTFKSLVHRCVLVFIDDILVYCKD